MNSTTDIHITDSQPFVVAHWRDLSNNESLVWDASEALALRRAGHTLVRVPATGSPKDGG